MSNDLLMEKMLTTIIDGQGVIVKKQDEQATDIKEIRSSMIEIVKLEAQQVSQKEALTRMGNHIDKLEQKTEQEYKENHARINSIDDQVTDLRIMSARMVVKVSMIAAGASAVVASAFAYAVSHLP